MSDDGKFDRLFASLERIETGMQETRKPHTEELERIETGIKNVQETQERHTEMLDAHDRSHHETSQILAGPIMNCLTNIEIVIGLEPDSRTNWNDEMEKVRRNVS